MAEKIFRIEVEAYSGYKADERPKRFKWKQRYIGVEEVLDRWYGEDADYFRVRGDDGTTYLLRHLRHQAEWELIMANKT